MKIKSLLIVLTSLLIYQISYGIDAYLTMENDTFLKQQDNDYTHGTKLELVNDRYHYMIQQTMYAPDDLRREDHIKGDRPYCGMLIGGIGYEFINTENQNNNAFWTGYGELDFGVIGPAAGCKETQSLIHKILGCREPKGWSNQLHNEVVVNGQWWSKYNYYINDWIALVPRIGTAAGTIQDMVEVGCDLKIGYNIKPTVSNGIIFSGSSKKKTNFSLYGYIGCDERYYLYNHILEGSMFGHKDDGLDVDINPFVTEFKAGIVLKYDRFFATYYAIFRTDEFKHQKNAPDYGGISIGWSF